MQFPGPRLHKGCRARREHAPNQDFTEGRIRREARKSGKKEGPAANHRAFAESITTCGGGEPSDQYL
jgi:hypothetical protein